MTVRPNPLVKRPYSAPTLVTFGEMALLTKGGTGSVLEAGNQNSKQRA